ncbi:ABC-F family ATP-binding cassette domain-containing protein [Candidatus Paracaedibacter symbiosus]|uniref:ABC-F family ATP-binding cassette domain-containing protein n=1 Tax=Candidatus Paracaedibacter symbiosus TaxID=244582 RepID=UPI0005098311|nr:ATP-binding cassette domain-containing protein [Candidatus Paracaedibacter symbiosus]
MSTPPLFALRDISLTFGGKPLFQNITLQISKGDRISLVGRNGTGKSTLLKIIAGMIDIDDGERFVQPGTKIAYLPQDVDFPESATVIDYICNETDAPRYEVEAILGELNMPPERIMQGLSGGERRRISLATALVQQPDILLLDEPTNHLDIPAIEWLEDTLKSFRGAFLVISHDRAFLEKVSTSTLWLDRGNLHQNSKGYADFERWSDFLLQEEERQLEKIDTKLRQEMDWLHRGVTARRKRNQGRLRQLGVLRMEKRSRLSNQVKSLKLGSLDTEVSSKMVIEAKDISKSFGDQLLVNNFSTRIIRGDRIGIVGPNGTGKSTLLKLLVGAMKPDSGRVRLGAKNELIYFDQMRDSLKLDESLWNNLCETGGDQVMVRGQHRHIMSYLKDFMFEEKQVRSPVAILSGGEKNRLALAKSLAQPSNVLVLDEPTNDLDMDTLDLLLDTLSEYEGTLIIVSHDRDFLDKLTTSIIAFEGDGVIEEYVGGYSDYLSQRKPRQPAPKSLKTEKIAQTLQEKPLRKFTYNEKRDYEVLPKTMDTLQAEIKTIEAKLDHPNFYQNHHHEFITLTARLETAKIELDAAELRWLELDEKING